MHNPIIPPSRTVLNHLTLLLLHVPGFAGGSDHGAAAGHASGGAGVAEDSAAGGAFGGVAAGADFVGDGAAVAEVLLILGFVDALLVHHHALGRGAGGGEQGGEGDQGLREAGGQPALIDGEPAGEVVSKPVVGVDQH